MSMVWEREQIKAQIIDTERLLSMVESHPIMSYSLRSKLEDLQSRLKEFPENAIEAKIRLLFSGNAVKGSLGIKSKFLSETLKPFQELVKTQTALVRFGKVGKRGKNKESVNSELYLTALPTGSFGVELSQLETNNLFAEEDVATAIHQVMELIEAATNSDETFEEILGNTPVRNLNNLKSFLRQIDEEDSILKLESGTFELEIPEEKIHQGFERVNAATNEDEELLINGILRGILLDSGKFEIQDDDGYRYTGFVSTDIPEEEVIRYNVEFLNQPCVIHLRKSKTQFISGTEKTSFELLQVQPR
jgi:hypothetical protein